MIFVRSYLSLGFAQLAEASAYMSLWFGAKSYQVASAEQKKHHDSGRRAYAMLVMRRTRREQAHYEKTHAWEHATNV
jgi:hypothetical protein